jgi:hypothetical protein
MMRIFAILLCTALSLLGSPSDTEKPERTVEGQTLISKSLPAARLTAAPAFKYLAGQRFPLYGVAEAEQHFFVDADKAGNIQRFYWIQFEHYLPDNDHTYDYEPVRTAKIGPLEFIHDTKMFTDYGGNEWPADSDSGHMKATLTAAGLKLPKETVRTRTFHLPGRDKRSELMIIYVEAMKPGTLPKGVTGETPADERFPAISKATLQHAQANLTIKAP